MNVSDERIKYKLLSLTHKVLTTKQSQYLDLYSTLSVTTLVLHLWSLLLVHRHCLLQKLLIALLGMLHLLCGMNSPLNSSHLVRYSPLHFLANVNSCSCSLYVVVRPSVCRLSSVCLSSAVCRLSVTFVHPTQPIEIFRNVSAPFNKLVT